MTEKEIKKFWEDLSYRYQKKHKIPIKSVHYGPGVPDENKLKLLGNVRAKYVLELGCGGAQCGIAMAKKGAIVTGIDISKNQLKFAKQLAEKNKVKINLIQRSFQDLNKFNSNSYDVVFSAYALHYSPNLSKVFRQVYRVLKKKGLFVFSFDHPFWSCISPKNFKIKYNYFKTGKIVEKEVWRDGSKHMYVGYFRKVSDLYNNLKETGFETEKILEPYSGGETWLVKDSSYPKKLMEMIPTTIIFKARKK